MDSNLPKNGGKSFYRKQRYQFISSFGSLSRKLLGISWYDLVNFANERGGGGVNSQIERAR